MRAALDCIAPSSMYGRRAYLLALLQHRVTWGAVKHWAAGRNTPPQWAREIIKEKLQEQADARRALQQQIG